jgi:fatty acid desaturase
MENKPLQLGELKKLVGDCFKPDPWIYWGDMVVSAVLAWGAFYITEISPSHSALELIGFVISVFAFYRGGLFIHELTHQNRRDLPGFSLVWHGLFGIPMLFPSFMYRGVHIEHHKKNTYGTAEDGEYLPFGASPFWKSLFYVSQSLLIPLLVVFRFGVIGPVSLLHPRLRSYVMTHASSLNIRLDTARKLPSSRQDLIHWYVQEALCFAWVAFVAVLAIKGIVEAGTLRHVYLLLVTIFTVNSVRTLVAHRYKNRAGKELSFTDQYVDSVNFEGNPVLAGLVAPVGLRYHALHHLFPAMPYHNLTQAHRRLLAGLPKDSAYHLANEPSLWSAIATLWHNAQNTPAEENATHGSARA